MSNLTIGLLLALLSTCATALAHAFLKAGRDKLAVQAWIRLVGLAVAIPFAIWMGPPPVYLIWWIVGAAAIHAVYQFVVSWSYSVSDFSVAFPLARGATPIFTCILGVALLGDRLGTLMIAGVAIVSVGILLLALRGGVTRIGLAAAALAAMLTTAYTIVDAHAVRIAPEPLLFIAWFFVADGFSMPAALFARSRGNGLAALAGEARTGAAAGVVTLFAFVPALFAFALAPVGAVSALRECSILIGLALGGTMLKEKLDGNRIAGAALIVLGGLAIVAQSF